MGNVNQTTGVHTMIAKYRNKPDGTVEITSDYGFEIINPVNGETVGGDCTHDQATRDTAIDQYVDVKFVIVEEPARVPCYGCDRPKAVCRCRETSRQERGGW